jgi:hypothetical protein
MELDKSLIILALETLREQVSDDAYEHGVNQKRLDRIDKQIEELTWFEGDPPTRTINEYRQVKTFGYTQKED